MIIKIKIQKGISSFYLHTLSKLLVNINFNFIDDSKKLMTDSNINFHNNPWTNRNNENALNNNCEINIFPDQRIYFEKKDNNNSTNSINLRPNNIRNK